MQTPAKVLFAVVLLITAVFLAKNLNAHCDTLDGPVVRDAKRALQEGEVKRVLKWVGEKDEQQIRDAFDQAMKVRGLGDEARTLADLHFFETLVRVHRAGEGVAYTGLKPAGSLEPGIAAADKALEEGSVDDLASELTKAIDAGVRKRFTKVKAAKEHTEHNVEAGRAFVAAYVEYIHYVEAIHELGSAPIDVHHHIHASDE
jgi:hypothetical protein